VEPRAQLERREALTAARSAIHALSEPEKEVFLLRTSGGLTFEAAAEALGIPVGTAKTRMRAALGRLRAALAAHAPATQDGRQRS
jgi:RNA polymerase sigma-70 factor (ECF subfamily)